MTEVHQKNPNQINRKGIISPMTAVKTKKKSRQSRKGKEAVEFALSAVYTLDETAAILRRTPNTIRKLAKAGRILYRKDSGGFLFSGWSIKDYAEGRAVV